MRLFVPLLIASNIRRTLCYGFSEEPATETVGYTLEKFTRYFRNEKIPEPESSAVNIMAYVLNTDRITDVYDKNDMRLTHYQEKEMGDLCGLRMERWPVQYIIKEWNFRELKLKMRQPVFIPRPETEELVDIVYTGLNFHKESTDRHLNILEIGCGTGAISLALKYLVPELDIIAVDVTKHACKLARENARFTNLKITVVEGELTRHGNLICERPDLIESGKFHAIVSNPPYVPTRELFNLPQEIKIFEDLMAIDGGPQGLTIIKAIMRFASYMLPINGSIFLETDVHHPKMIKEWTERKYDKFGLVLKKVFKDFNNKDRFVLIKKAK